MLRYLPPLLLLLAGCGGPELRYAIPALAPAERVAIGFSSVEVRDVALPVYAQAEGIAVRGDDGAIVVSSDLLWADDPSRAMTLELSRVLAQLSGRPVAPEPWPFDPFPAVRVEIRVEEMVADTAGIFRLSGQYFIAALDGTGRDRSGLFDIATPLGAEAGPVAIAAARGEATRELALLIAREGLR